MIVKTLRAAQLPVGELFEAENGRQGLELLAEHWIDVVFADLNMPVMNGEEMIHEIRSKPLWKELPIIVVSTEGSKTRIESLRAKDTEFVHKPFAPETVRDVVTNLIGVKP
jgi:two-component system chemotaxis response regulator CheY